MDKISTTGVIDQTIYSDGGNVMYIVNVELNGNIVKAQSIHYLNKLDIENPIIRINTAFKGCSSLEKISVLPRIYHN